jgi:uncharacterized membrane protein YphA (DoxX/SURF4 family)
MDLALLLARWMLCAHFALEFSDKIRRFGYWTEVVRRAGFPAPAAEMALVVFLLAVGIASLVTGWHTELGISALLLVLAPSTLFFDSRPGAAKSLSIAGGLVCLWCVGPGAWSLDTWLAATP